MDEPVRYAESVTLVASVKDGISLNLIAARTAKDAETEFAGDVELEKALGTLFDSSNGAVADIAGRARFLDGLMKEGRVSREEVRQAARQFTRSRS